MGSHLIVPAAETAIQPIDFQHPPELPVFVTNSSLCRIARAIAELLASHPVAELRHRRAKMILVPRGPGMTMTVAPTGGGSWFVTIGGWSDYFDDDGVVVRVITKALMGQLRVISLLRGDVIHGHALEALDSRGEWWPAAELTYVRITFFPKPLRKQTSKYPSTLS